jgi:C4-dicarboxylate-specific signal transduction histidine kinase
MSLHAKFTSLLIGVILVSAALHAGIVHVVVVPATQRIAGSSPQEAGRAALFASWISAAQWLLLMGAGACLVSVRLRALVARRVARLAAFARALGTSQDLSERIPDGDCDEVGDLSRALNEMAGRLAEARSEAMDSSRRAGRAELARGILHNAGNLLTSASVSAAWLQDRVRCNRLNTLVRVAALLEQNRSAQERYLTADPRGRKLPELIIALGRHWEEESGRIQEELRNLRQSLAATAEILGPRDLAGGEVPKIEAVAVEEVVAHVLGLLDSTLRQHGVRVATRFRGSVTALADRRRLVHALVNLVLNAAEAVESEPPHARIVELECEPDLPGRCRILVRDQGPGVPVELQSRLFTPGFTTKAQGTGLGLYVSAEALREIGGEVSHLAQSSRRGATFAIRLPAAARVEAVSA